MAGTTVKWVDKHERALAETSVNTLIRIPIDGMSTLLMQTINHGGGEWAYTVYFYGRVTVASELCRIYGVNKETYATESGCTDEGIWSFSVGGLVEMAFELDVLSGSPEVSIDIGLSSAPWSDVYCCEELQ